jgi:hypothetical protein
MKHRSFSIASFYFLQRSVAAGVGIAIATDPLLAAAQCMEKLKGKIYTNLPTDLCPRYTDMLLGQSPKKQEYGGVICDRPEASYILLQRLLRHTNQGKAVWQIIQVQPISKPNPQSLILGTGCRRHLQPQNTGSTEPIFALVQPISQNTYQTLSAWSISLNKESFAAIDARQVICKDLLRE